MSAETLGVKPLSRREIQAKRRQLLINLILAIADHGEFVGTASFLHWLFTSHVKPEQRKFLPASPRGLSIALRSIYEDVWLAGVDIDFHHRTDPRTRAAVLRIAKADKRPSQYGVADGIARGGD